MKVHTGFGNLFRLSAVVLLVTGLSACGGSSGGGTSDGTGVVDSSSTTTSFSPITESNYEMVAQTALSKITSGQTAPGVSTQSVGLELNSSASLGESRVTQSLMPMAVSASDCDSGSGTEDSNFQILGNITEGDHFTDTYNNCRSNFSSSAYSLTDGSLKGSYSRVTGDHLNGGIGTYTMSTEHDQYLMESQLASQPKFSIMIDGDTTYEAERTSLFNRWKRSHKKFEIVTKEGGVTDLYSILTDSYSEWIDTYATNTFTLKGKYDLDFVSGPVAASFVVEDDLAGSLDFGEDEWRRDNVSSGTIIISDNLSNAVITVTILSATEAKVECDLNGDGIPNVSKTINIG